MKVSFLGFGKFAKRLAAGLQTDSRYQCYASSPSVEVGCQQGVKTLRENKAAVQDAECVILAVKPPQARDVLKEVAKSLSPGSLLISVVTGVSTDDLLACCPPSQAIVRAMPNTPCAIGQGATALYKGEAVSETQARLANDIFKTLGYAAWVSEERDVDRLTALSGSGPAYVFLFLEALIQGGVKLGLAEEVAKSFAIEMVKGSVLLATQSDDSLSALRASVTSPGGTTQAALEAFEAGQFKTLVYQAMEAAFLRSQALAKAEHKENGA